MALIWITYVPDADRRGPDLTRMNKVEEVPDELARMMLQDGSAREATPEELAAHEGQAAVEAKAAEVEDLSSLKKDELLALLPEDKHADLPARATKADIQAAVEEHRAGLEQAHADTLAMTRTDVATSGDPAGTIAAVNEQTAAAEASAGE
jgi:hypothetical protein